MTENSSTIPLDGDTKRFFQGVTAGSKVREAHAAVTADEDTDVRSRLFWFYVGALAVGEHGCESQEDFTSFIAGAATRAPEGDVSDEFVMRFSVANAAFRRPVDDLDANEDESEVDRDAVVAELHNVAEVIGYGHDGGKVHDANGNTVGKWSLT